MMKHQIAILWQRLDPKKHQRIPFITRLEYRILSLVTILFGRRG